MPTLKSLTLRTFRHVDPGTSLQFRPGLNVLLGKNATGKTTLLGLIASALSLDFSDFAREAFAFSFTLAHQELTLECSADNSRVDPALGEPFAQVPNLPSTDSLLPRVSLSIKKGAQVLIKFQATGAQGQREFQGLAPSEKVAIPGPLLEQNLFFHIFAGVSADETAWLNRLWPTLSVFFRFPSILRLDESLEFLNRVLFSAKVRINGTASGIGGWGMLAPPTVVAAVLDAIRANQDASSVPVTAAPFLNTIALALGFRSATLHVERSEKSPIDQNGNWTADYGSFRFEFARHDGSVIDHKKLSYGQSRMLAFHYWLATYEGVAVADELVNGLHHAWIANCVDALAGRQSFLTTQNPLLLDYLSFNSEEDVGESFILCTSAFREGGTEHLRWENMNERNTHAFYKAYTAGIQHVSEILTSRGLW